MPLVEARCVLLGENMSRFAMGTVLDDLAAWGP
jgi:hypothetical protein